MATPVVNIVIPQGADFTQTLTLKESNGTAKNLSGYYGYSVLKKHEAAETSVPFTVGITSVAGGKITISMTDTTSVALTPGRYRYDLITVSGFGTVTREVEGMAMVTAGITTELG